MKFRRETWAPPLTGPRLAVKWNFRQKCANESTEFWKSIEKYNLITSFLSKEEWIIMVLALTFWKLLRSQGSPLPVPTERERGWERGCFWSCHSSYLENSTGQGPLSKKGYTRYLKSLRHKFRQAWNLRRLCVIGRSQTFGVTPDQKGGKSWS